MYGYTEASLAASKLTPFDFLSQLTREIGYAEQSVLTRSCRRWFGCSPTDYRKRLHFTPAETDTSR